MAQKLHKIVVVGQGGSGKSAFTIQFVQKVFAEEYDPTIEDIYRKRVNVDDEFGIVDILDTAGEEEFSGIRDQWIYDGQGFVLLYAINNRRSFDELGKHFKDIIRIKDPEGDTTIPCVIVGNKCDLVAQREVPEEEGQELAELMNFSFFETSAKERTNVEEVFHELVRSIRKCICNPTTSHRKPKSKNCFIM